MVIRKCISLFCKSYKYKPFNTFVKSLTVVRSSFHQTVCPRFSPNSQSQSTKAGSDKQKSRFVNNSISCMIFVKYLKFIRRIQKNHWYDRVSHNRGCLQTQQNYVFVSMFKFRSWGGFVCFKLFNMDSKKLNLTSLAWETLHSMWLVLGARPTPSSNPVHLLCTEYPREREVRSQMVQNPDTQSGGLRSESLLW